MKAFHMFMMVAAYSVTYDIAFKSEFKERLPD